MATNIGGSMQANPGIFSLDTSTQQASLGSSLEVSDGRRFRYCKAGGTALVVGDLQQAPAENTGFQNLGITATAAGAYSVNVTPGATTATANLFADGLLIISVTPGLGYAYAVSAHGAVSSSTAFDVTISDAIQVALTTSSKADLVMNPYKGVIINPTTASSSPVGSAVTAITASQFGWIQVGGQAALLADGTVTVGTGVVASNATAGAVEALTGVQAPVGTAITGIATGEVGAILLALH